MPILVKTESGDDCKFPFNYDDTDYYACIVGGPNNPDNLPQCITTQDKWSFCKVPNSAAVTGISARKGGFNTFSTASMNGGALLWIFGKSKA